FGGVLDAVVHDPPVEAAAGEGTPAANEQSPAPGHRPHVVDRLAGFVQLEGVEDLAVLRAAEEVAELAAEGLAQLGAVGGNDDVPVGVATQDPGGGEDGC